LTNWTIHRDVDYSGDWLCDGPVGRAFQQLPSLANTSLRVIEPAPAGLACARSNSLRRNSIAPGQAHVQRLGDAKPTAAHLTSGCDLHLHHLVGIGDRLTRALSLVDHHPLARQPPPSPITVYWPFQGTKPSANMMKNCEFPPSWDRLVRAMPTIPPRLNGTLENSAGRFGYLEPPVPLKILGRRRSAP